MMELTNRHPGEVTGAWLLIRSTTEVEQLRDQLNRARMPLKGLYRAWIHVTDALTGLCASLLAEGRTADRETIERTIAIASRIPRYRDTDEKARIGAMVGKLRTRGVPKQLAQRCVNATDLTLAELISRLQAEREEGDRDAIVRTLAIGKASRLLPAIRVLENRSSAGRWDPIAIGILRQRYLDLLGEAVRRTPVGAQMRLRSDRLAHKLLWGGTLRNVATVLDGVLAEPPDISAFLVAEERVRVAISELG